MGTLIDAVLECLERAQRPMTWREVVTCAGAEGKGVAGALQRLIRRGLVGYTYVEGSKRKRAFYLVRQPPDVEEDPGFEVELAPSINDGDLERVLIDLLKEKGALSALQAKEEIWRRYGALVSYDKVSRALIRLATKKLVARVKDRYWALRDPSFANSL